MPFPFGVKPAIVDTEGRILEGACEGNLVLLDSWPGQMRTVYGDHQRFVDTYFKTFAACISPATARAATPTATTGSPAASTMSSTLQDIDWAPPKSKALWWRHADVAEAAVVGFPHDIKGEGIYVYVTLIAGVDPSEPLRAELKNWVRREIGPIATPDAIQWAPGLPKTRSGKIMRRILRKIAADEQDQLGDISTLADPSVVEQLVAEHARRHPGGAPL